MSVDDLDFSATSGTVGAALSAPRCLPCSRNQHAGCDHHMNDGAGDAMDFIPVSCRCPCQGEVGDVGLLGLVVGLRQEIAGAERHQARSAEVLEQLVAKVQAVVEDLAAKAQPRHYYDDEGNLLYRPGDFAVLAGRLRDALAESR